MNKKHNACLTGATGFLGSHFLVNNASYYDNLYTIVRGADDVEASSRLSSIIKAANAAYQKSSPIQNIHTFTGDIERTQCQLTDSAILELQNQQITDFWHFAASLAFEDDKRDQIYQQNVVGVTHALELARLIGAERFIYISTAYTVGTFHGLVDESFHAEKGPFNNYYEESKCQAEYIVKNYCLQHNIQYRILRPSIVIGPAISKKTGGSTSGLYGFLREAIKLKAYPKGVLRKIRLHGESSTTINLIPVDWLMQDIGYLIKNKFGQKNIYHLSANEALSFDDVLSVIKSTLDLDELEISEENFSPNSKIEKQFADRIIFYNSYIKNKKDFIRELPSSWKITKDELKEFVENAILEMN